MYFTQSEIIALNSVLDGSGIFGVKVKTPENATEDYHKAVIESMREKGMVSQTGNQPTMLFAETAKILENYKNAKKHIFINSISVGIDKDLATAFIPKDDGYEILRTHKFLFLVECVLANKALCAADSAEIASYVVEHKSWANNVFPKLAEDLMLIQVFDNKRITEMLIFYQLDGADYIYYPADSRCVKCGSLQKRKELCRVMGIDESVEVK